MNGASEALERLLGPFGFRTLRAGDGHMQVERLQYALMNYRRLKPTERALLRQNPLLADRYGVRIFPTDAELAAEDAVVAYRTLPDGTLLASSLADYREAVENNRINHILEQLDSIANSGPGALVGRIIDGERGAALGGLVDAGLMAAAPLKARRAIRAQMTADEGGGTGLPAPLEPLGIRAPAPERTAVPTPDPPGGAPPTELVHAASPPPPASALAATPSRQMPAPAPPTGPVPPALAPDPRGIDRGNGMFEIRGVPAAQPSKEAVKRAEQEVENLVLKRYGSYRDLSEKDKDPYTPGVDRLFIIGKGEGAVLLEVDAKLSIQESPVRINEVSAFATAAKTGGSSRQQLLDAALKSGLISADEYQSFTEDVEQGRVLEEVHGFGAVTGLSKELRAGKTLESGHTMGPVSYAQGEQFAHIKSQVEERESRALSADIEMTLVVPAADRRTGRQIANQIFKEFEKEFGLAKKPRAAKRGGDPP
jgi:hypothetical protein